MNNGVSAITLFAGAGGWDLGFAACDVPILAALNHNKRSLATHRLNFASTRQVLTDITKDDPAAYPHATILQASPECRYQSNAKGEKRHPKNKTHSRKKTFILSQNQPTLWPEMSAWTDGEEAEPAARSRATMNEAQYMTWPIWPERNTSMSGEYPRKHVDLIISQDGETRIEPFEFVPEDGQDPWEVIHAKQEELFADGATAANTCNYRTLLDRDGYRE